MTVMRAAVTSAFGVVPELCEVPRPEPRPGELLIRVGAVGLCGSDLKINSGAIPTVSLPRIQGHEVAGEVVDGNDEWAPGQRVAVYIHQPCGHCAWCARGATNLCPNDSRMGFERDGGFADYVLARSESLIPLPPGMAFETAAVSMDAVLTPWRAVHKRARVGAGDHLVLVGSGGLGLHAVQIAVAEGARVAVLDPSETRRAAAIAAGAELALHPDEAHKILSWSSGGADAAIEMSGAVAGFGSAVSSVRNGGVVVCCGYKPGVDVSVDWTRLALGELTVMGSRGGTREDAREAIAAVGRGDVRPVIAAVAELEDLPKLFDQLARGETVGRLVVSQLA